MEIVNLDALTYAGNPENLTGLEKRSEYSFVHGDICVAEDVEHACGLRGIPDAIVNFAAESHVDRSIEDAAVFLRTNILGTQVLLETARRLGVPKFIQVSTDEVYGSLGPQGAFTEDTPLAPNSPYAASKAGADLLVRAYHHTYGLPVCTTRCSNNYGPRQFPEKLIPLMLANALENKELPIYGDGLHVRDWIYVDDHCAGIMAVLEKGRSGEVYNFGGCCELTNIDLVKKLLALLDKPESLIRFVQDRPGHDRRYAMQCAKAQTELGWSPAWNLSQGLQATVGWYLENQDWVGRVRSGAYREYYQRQYEQRDEWIHRMGS